MGVRVAREEHSQRATSSSEIRFFLLAVLSKLNARIEVRRRTDIAIIGTFQNRWGVIRRFGDARGGKARNATRGPRGRRTFDFSAT
jgi:hypothetical protein